MIDIVLSILIGSMAAIMAVVGGVLATEKRYIKKMFVFMGIASVILIAVQSVRLSRIQKKSDEVQAELLHEQNKFAESYSGGDSVPFVILFPDFQHPGKVAFILKNLDKKNTLHDLTIYVSAHMPDGDLRPKLIQTGFKWDVERLNPQDVNNAPITLDMDSPVDVFKFTISARNGNFTEMFTTKDGKNRFTMKKEEELIYDSERKEDRVGVFEVLNSFLN